MKQIKKGVCIISRLAEVRKAKGLTQRRLAFLSGVHRVSIARYEAGKVSPNVRVLRKLADTLGVKVDDLIDRKAG